MPVPEEDANANIKEERDLWRKMAVDDEFTPGTKSSLADLPITKARNNYSEMINGRLELTRLVHQSDMLAPMEARLYYETEEYAVELAELTKEVCKQLDTNNLGSRLMAHWREKENEFEGKYCLIFVSALLMRAGAKTEE